MGPTYHELVNQLALTQGKIPADLPNAKSQRLRQVRATAIRRKDPRTKDWVRRNFLAPSVRPSDFEMRIAFETDNYNPSPETVSRTYGVSLLQARRRIRETRYRLLNPDPPGKIPRPLLEQVLEILKTIKNREAREFLGTPKP